MQSDELHFFSYVPLEKDFSCPTAVSQSPENEEIQHVQATSIHSHSMVATGLGLRS